MIRDILKKYKLSNKCKTEHLEEKYKKTATKEDIEILKAFTTYGNSLIFFYNP